MFSVQEVQHVDQELSLELTESLINPAFIHMSTPLTNCYDPLFYLQINSKALWKWPEFKMDLTQIFHALQDGLASIAYKLNLSSKVCVRTAVKGRVYHVMKRVTSKTNDKKRKNFRSQYWAKIALHLDEIFQSSQGIIEELKEGKEELAEECKKLRIEVEGEETLIIPKGFNKANISFFDLPL